MSEIKCNGLNKHFRQGDSLIKALDNVSVVIESGEFVCLSGPSGSGKTTLLNAIGALDHIDSGEVYVGDKAVHLMSQNEKAMLRLQDIGFVFQAYNLIPVLSAAENVEFVMQMQGISPQTRRQRAIDILREVGLEGLAHRLPSELSGGQQQRVAVARAIVSEPAIVLADEPTANLDSTSSNRLMELFVKLNKSHKITFVIATHDENAMAYCRRRITMVDGKIVKDEQQQPKQVA